MSTFLQEYNLSTPSIIIKDGLNTNLLTFLNIIIKNGGNNFMSSTYYPNVVGGIPYPRGTFLLLNSILYFAFEDAPVGNPPPNSVYWVPLSNI